MQAASPTMMTPASGPSDTLPQITCALFLNAAQAAAIKADPLVTLTIDEDIEEYHRELKLFIDLQKEVQVIRTDNTDYTECIVSLEDDLKTTNKTIRILQGLMTIALTLRAIELPHPPQILAGENGRFSDDQHKLPYVYGYLKGNSQNQIQPYVQTDKISLEDIEAIIKILEATFGDPDEVGMASGELDHLTQGNREFSIYYAEF
jgi:hypothetical protein